ncbi:MAG: metallophosphoesterase family protein [Planctomycetota bacterium]|jgi:predicted MPP superfamily phosphohydrolase
MLQKKTNILVISDFHYINKAEQKCELPARITSLGSIFMRKALWRLHHQKIKPDLIILLGDVVDDGTDKNSVADFKEIIKEVEGAGIPMLTVPGNHDIDPEVYAEISNCTAGFHQIEGIGFYVFHDLIGEGDVTARPADALADLQKVSVELPDLPLIALQHNPIFPDIESEYPFIPENVTEIRKCYEKAGVKLSLSGHYHAGQTLTENNGVKYYTVPAICSLSYRICILQ